MAVHELSSPPSMTTLYPRAAAGAGLSLLRRLPVVPGAPEELPDSELLLSGIEIDREHLAAYARVCTFSLADQLPITYPHVLAFPLAMKLMTDASFPFAAVGLVHVGNRITQLRPIGIDEPLTLRVRTDRLAPHERGTQFEVLAEAEVGGDTVWRSASTYLHREGGSSGDDSKKRAEPPEPTTTWTVPGDIGRRYAAVSGDRNPIHMHPLGGRLFGMPTAIAHGMWVKARCLAVLEARPLPPAYTVDVSFKLPVLLGERVAFATSGEGDRREFAVHDAKSGKPHLMGRIEPSADGGSAP